MDGFLKGKRYLIVDRDALFSDQFKAILRSSGTKVLWPISHSIDPRAPFGPSA